MKRRSGNVDIWRFVMSLFIMLHHSYAFTRGDYLHDGWLYVMFFFMITGWYTARHFDGPVPEHRMKVSLEYTLSKFKPLWPYVIAATLAGWALQNFPLHGFGFAHIRQLLSSFGDALLDIFMVGDVFGYPIIPPVWYLSAMFLVFPLFCLSLQTRRRWLLLWGSLLAVTVYFGTVGFDFELRFMPWDYLRALAGLYMGVLLYGLFRRVPEKLPAGLTVLLTAAEVLCLVFPILSMLADAGTPRLNLLCFLIGGGLLLSGRTATACIGGKAASWLGRFSVPLYITHWVPIMVLRKLEPEWGDGKTLAVFYLASLALALVCMVLYERLPRLKNWAERPVVLPEEK